MIRAGVKIPVIMCVYSRVNRLPKILDQLAAQKNCSFELYLWNNNPSAKDALRDIKEEYPRLDITIFNSKKNVGGFGRFMFAKRIQTQSPAVIFLDDDINLTDDALETLVTEFQPETIRSFYAFKFNVKDDYNNRRRLNPGEAADYCGTGGMICDISIFKENGLYSCPEQYWFIEDLWLCYYANHLLGWGLYKSAANISLVEDGKNQFMQLKNLKTDFLKYLVDQGWEVGASYTSTAGKFVKGIRLWILFSRIFLRRVISRTSK